MEYSAIYNNVFEALNLLLVIFYTYVAEIRPPGNGIRLLSRTKCVGCSSAMARHCGDFHHIM